MKQMFLACWAPHKAAASMPARLSQALARAGCTECLPIPSLRLFATADLELRTLGNGGVVIGQLFDAAGQPAPVELDDRLFGLEREAIVDRYWGSYLAMVAAPSRARFLRDPSGGLATYHVTVGQTIYLTSSPHLLIDCAIVDLELDWKIIARSVSSHELRGVETALRGVLELLPGRAMIAGERAEPARPVWDAWASACKNRRRDAVPALEQTLTSTLAAWARTARRPLIEISGGLDSAIVAAGVAAAAPSASLLTFAAAPGDPDETAYARALAEHMGLPLEIVRPRVDDVDLTRSMGGDLPRPNARAFVQAADLLSLRRAEAIGADAFFSGGGGDDVFCYLRTILPAIDRLRSDGIQAMLATCADIAVMNHATLWEALWKAARHLARGTAHRRKAERLFLDGGALTQHLAADASPADCAMPGKAAHVEAVLSIHNYLEGHRRAAFAPIHSPLLSQPIVECCLSIPAWLWCAKGQNRAIARQAFASRLPSILLERRSKGSFDGFCAQLFDRRRKIIAELLLEGHLAKQGLIDREPVGLALRDPFPPPDTIGRLLALVDAESWVASWVDRRLHRR